MKTDGFNPGKYNGLHEYIFLARPDEAVLEKVNAERKIFSDEYKEKFSEKITPHIKLAHFFAREEMEETILRWMQRICSMQPSFPVSLNNYSGFPPDTIYLRVQNAQPFHKLAKELCVINNYVSSCSCPPVKIFLKPHVSIAKKLPEEAFYKALKQYAHKSFHETFLVNELLLIKRKHMSEECTPVNLFALQPQSYQLTHSI